MNLSKCWTTREMVLAVSATIFVFFLHGAVPFFAIPTLGQAIWTAGFSQSFTNGSFFNIYAHDFGLPQPAAIAFGLSGAWPASILIRLGLLPLDAYAAMAAFWLGLAYLSAYKISRRFGGTRTISLLGAVAWMSMPIIWAHADYSMLSLGIALLAYYFLIAMKLFLVEAKTETISLPTSALYFSTVIVSVFMDGYTFIMFAVAASVLLTHMMISRKDLRPILLKIALPIHSISFASAYILYSSYVRTANFKSQNIDFFRGWGLDLSFLAVPTKGMLWLPDLLGLSLHRTDELYFGDNSVWVTTFALPVVLVALGTWLLAKKRMNISTSFLIMAVFAFYMALGPSLKINSTKSISMQQKQPGQQSQMMPEALAIMPTGTAWISENIPGLDMMRASYRWSALGVFASWLLIMLYISKANGKKSGLHVLILLILILFNLPNLLEKWRGDADNRAMANQIDDKLISPLKKIIGRGDTVAFIPYGNDFFANYLAPMAGFKTYNIGGDKNLLFAQTKWPDNLLPLGDVPNQIFTTKITQLFLDGTVDNFIVPYFSMRWAPYIWPCVDKTIARIPEEVAETFHRIKGFTCPEGRKSESADLIKDLSLIPFIQIEDGDLFASVKLKTEYAGPENRKKLEAALINTLQYPIVINPALPNLKFILNKGWNSVEPGNVWSTAESELSVPIHEDCDTKSCSVILSFSAFGAAPGRPLDVTFRTETTNDHWSKTLTLNSNAITDIFIPIRGKLNYKNIFISVPHATSPQELAGTQDNRVLGIGLSQINFSAVTPDHLPSSE